MRFLERDPSHAETRGDRNKRFRSYLYNSILDKERNKIERFVSTANRSTDATPLTMDMLEKSLFTCFLYREPVGDNMATDAYKRDQEIENNIALMNMLHDLALGGWNPKAGQNDGNQRRLNRLFRSKAIMAWAELLRDAICGKLEVQDSEERARLLYREMSPTDMEKIKRVLERLINWQGWAAPPNDDIDRVLADNKSAVKDWLRSHGLTTGYLMGAAE